MNDANQSRKYNKTLFTSRKDLTREAVNQKNINQDSRLNILNTDYC